MPNTMAAVVEVSFGRLELFRHSGIAECRDTFMKQVANRFYRTMHHYLYKAEGDITPQNVLHFLHMYGSELSIITCTRFYSDPDNPFKYSVEDIISTVQNEFPEVVMAREDYRDPITGRPHSGIKIRNADNGLSLSAMYWCITANRAAYNWEDAGWDDMEDLLERIEPTNRNMWYQESDSTQHMTELKAMRKDDTSIPYQLMLYHGDGPITLRQRYTDYISEALLPESASYTLNEDLLEELMQ